MLKNIILVIQNLRKTLQKVQVTDVVSAAESTLPVWRQEAQLSPRDRAVLRVIEYFAKSLKISQGHLKSQGHSKWHSWEGYFESPY